MQIPFWNLLRLLLSGWVREEPRVKGSWMSLLLHLLQQFSKCNPNTRLFSVYCSSFKAQIIVISKVLGKVLNSFYFYKCYLTSLFLSSLCVYFSGFTHCHIVSPNKGIGPMANFTVVSTNLSLVLSPISNCSLLSWLAPSKNKPNIPFLLKLLISDILVHQETSNKVNYVSSPNLQDKVKANFPNMALSLSDLPLFSLKPVHKTLTHPVSFSLWINTHSPLSPELPALFSSIKSPS